VALRPPLHCIAEKYIPLGGDGLIKLSDASVAAAVGAAAHSSKSSQKQDADSTYGVFKLKLKWDTAWISFFKDLPLKRQAV